MEKLEVYNEDKYSPVCGTLVKLADMIGALIEADQSLELGIRSHHLESGRHNIINMYLRDKSNVCGIDVRPFFVEFIRD
jgi:putative hydrolases of HD superfamily